MLSKYKNMKSQTHPELGTHVWQKAQMLSLASHESGVVGAFLPDNSPTLGSNFDVAILLE